MNLTILQKEKDCDFRYFDTYDLISLQKNESYEFYTSTNNNFIVELLIYMSFQEMQFWNL